MSQNQNHAAHSQIFPVRQALKISAVERLASVPGNKKSAGLVAVAVHVAPKGASIRAFGKSRVAATPPVGFGRAVGGAPIKMNAAHITKPSTGRGVTYGPAKPGWFCGRAG